MLINYDKLKFSKDKIVYGNYFTNYLIMANSFSEEQIEYLKNLFIQTFKLIFESSIEFIFMHPEKGMFLASILDVISGATAYAIENKYVDPLNYKIQKQDYLNLCNDEMYLKYLYKGNTIETISTRNSIVCNYLYHTDLPLSDN